MGGFPVHMLLCSPLASAPRLSPCALGTDGPPAVRTFRVKEVRVLGSLGSLPCTGHLKDAPVHTPCVERGDCTPAGDKLVAEPDLGLLSWVLTLGFVLGVQEGAGLG